MATNYTSKRLALHMAEQFMESFSEPEPTSIGYVFVGNHVPYTNESVAPDITEASKTERSIWDNMFAAKKLTSVDSALVIKINRWVSGTVYYQYDDESTSVSQNESLYVMNSNNEVYKCLNNARSYHASYPSTVQPVGPGPDAAGVIYPNDGYIWKYMYAVSSTNKFLTNTYMPVPTSINDLGYNMYPNNIVDGGIYRVSVVTPGANQVYMTCTPNTFSSATNTIKLLTNFDALNIANGMAVTGNCIQSNTIVTNVITATQSIQLSKNTSAASSVTGNNLTIFPRIVIDGDGTGAALFTSSGYFTSLNGGLSRPGYASIGSGYTYATATVYAGATPATLRVIIGPKYGHGYHPAEELSANSVMISSKIGEYDSTEGGKIDGYTTIRQYGLLRDPNGYGNSTPVNSTTAPTFVSQLHTITVVTGSNYTANELVYQGTSSAQTFFGYVNSQTSSKVKLTKVRGNFDLGGALTGATSLISRSAVAIEYPDLQPYTGDILYANNITYIQRTPGQTEIFTLILKF